MDHDLLNFLQKLQPLIHNSKPEIQKKTQHEGSYC